MKKIYETIIFDLDGTLANTSEDVWVSLDYSGKKVFGKQIPSSFRENPANLSLGLDKIIVQLKENYTPDELKMFFNHTDQHYNELNTFENTSLYPKIEELLQKLNHMQKQVFIVTMKTYKATQALMNIKGWGSYFTDYYSPDGPGSWEKTKISALKHLLSNYNIEKKTAIYLGDSQNDIIAARTNGIESVGVLYGDGDHQLVISEKPSYTVSMPEELEKILL